MLSETEFIFTDVYSNIMWKFTNFKGHVDSIEYPDFKIHKNITIMIGFDLFAFFASWEDDKMNVTKFLWASLVKDGDCVPERLHLNTADDARYHFALAWHK